MRTETKSFFENVDRKIGSFGDLPAPAKKAYIWFFAVEACNEVVTAIDGLLPLDAECPNDIPESVWQAMFDSVAAFVGAQQFCYLEVRSEQIKALIMTHNEDVKEEHDSWESYAAWYKSGESHPLHDRFPCISFKGNPDIVYDGWNRLHHYLNRGDETIPILEM